MIKSVTVTNYLGESIKMELRFPEKSGFLITGITGLGPPKANINCTESSTSDGSIYNSAKVNSRNIVFAFKLLDSPTIEATRQKSYKYFPIKRQVKLLFETDTRICEIYGNVESNEPDIFSPQEATQISIICPDPYFYSSGIDGKKVTNFSAIEPSFEFPFSNESTINGLLMVGDIASDQEKNVYYPGDSEVGIVIYMHALGEVTNVTIYNSGTREVIKINTDKLSTLTGSTIIARDDIIISTVKGNKYVQLLRNGVYTNILNCVDKNPDWFQLSKGDNTFAFTADTGVTYLQFRVEYKIVYEGI